MHRDMAPTISMWTRTYCVALAVLAATHPHVGRVNAFGGSYLDNLSPQNPEKPSKQQKQEQKQSYHNVYRKGDSGGERADQPTVFPDPSLYDSLAPSDIVPKDVMFKDGIKVTLEIANGPDGLPDVVDYTKEGKAQFQQQEEEQSVQDATPTFSELVNSVPGPTSIVSDPPAAVAPFHEESASMEDDDEDNDDFLSFVSRSGQKASTSTPAIVPPPTPPPLPKIKASIDRPSPIPHVPGITKRLLRKLPLLSGSSDRFITSTRALDEAAQAWESTMEGIQHFRRPFASLDDDSSFVTADGALGNPKCWEKLSSASSSSRARKLDYDLLVCGGPIGVFYASYWQDQGFRVCFVETETIELLDQKIDYEELLDLVRLEIISYDDLANLQVKSQGDVGEANVDFDKILSPTALVDIVLKRFRKNGGVLVKGSGSNNGLGGLCVSPTVGVALDLGPTHPPVSARLLLDAMGPSSPIAAQQRSNVKPNGLCLVLGSFVEAKNDDKDKNKIKTTYTYSFLDAKKSLPSLEDLFDEHLELLPLYQPSVGKEEKDLNLQKLFVSWFPTYHDTLLKPIWDRVLAVDDASGIQSLPGLGNFGMMTRHLSRVGPAVADALDSDCVSKECLAEINTYLPNLSATRILQKVMSFGPGRTNLSQEIFHHLAMKSSGDILDTRNIATNLFLEKPVSLDKSSLNFLKTITTDPEMRREFVSVAGIGNTIEGAGHLAMMGFYTAMDTAVSPFLSILAEKVVKDPKQRFMLERKIDRWKWGAGLDNVTPDSD